MEKHSLIVPKTARYFTLGNFSESTNEIWIVLHGYAQLANYFIKNFISIQNPNNVIVAPEGLHRFYWQGFSGMVVASWMTKEDRLDDIKDYANFLELVYNDVLNKCPYKNVKINIFAFSQGTATVLRWLSIKKPIVNNLILWGGTFPADINFELDKNFFNKSNIYFVMGTEDEYISKEDVEEQEKTLNDNGIKFQSIRFNGKHVIDQPTLLQLIKEIQ